MIKGTDCAFPTGADGDPGLTKREYFAAKILMGLVSNSNESGNFAGHAEDAVIMADKLIKELNKEKPE